MIQCIGFSFLVRLYDGVELVEFSRKVRISPCQKKEAKKILPDVFTLIKNDLQSDDIRIISEKAYNHNFYRQKSEKK